MNGSIIGILKENFSHGIVQGMISTFLFIFLFVMLWIMTKDWKNE